MFETKKLVVVPLSLLTALAACSDDPPAPTDVRSAVHDDLGHILREAKAASDASTVNLPTGGAFGFATSLLGTGGSSISQRVLARTAADDEEGGFDPDAIVQKLETELFTDANYLGNGIYRVPASLACLVETYDEGTGMTTESVDPECASQLEQVQLRIRVADDDDGLRFFVQVDANHDEPLSVLLAHDQLSLTVNLDDATAALAAIAPLVGESAPNAALSGSITGTLQILGTAHAKASIDFDRAISIKLADEGISLDGPDAFRFTSAAARVISVDLDGNTPKAALDLGLGATTAHLPGDDASAATDLALGGATLDAVFEGGALTLTNVSLGETTTTLKVGGQTAMSIDLNPDAGRAFAATITADETAGTETVVVSPRFDLRTTVDHALLGDEAPAYDVTRILVDGSLRGSELTGQVEVLAGTFSMTTNPAQYGFTATAGQCVQETDIYDDETFTSYASYSVGACQ